MSKSTSEEDKGKLDFSWMERAEKPSRRKTKKKR